MWARRRKSLIIQFLGHKSPTLMPMAGARCNETIKRVIKRGKSRAIKRKLTRPLLPSSNQQNSQSALFKSGRELLFLPMRLRLHSTTYNWATRISMHLPPTKGASLQDEVIPMPTLWWKSIAHGSLAWTPDQRKVTRVPEAILSMGAQGQERKALSGCGGCCFGWDW